MSSLVYMKILITCQKSTRGLSEKRRVKSEKRYFREFSYGLELTYQITPQACISSATCCGISSMRSIVYHQAAGKSSPKGVDEIQGRNAPLMICTTLRAAMICQAYGLDKKIRILSNADFLAGAEGLEPTTHGFGDQYSTN